VSCSLANPKIALNASILASEETQGETTLRDKASSWSSRWDDESSGRIEIAFSAPIKTNVNGNVMAPQELSRIVGRRAEIYDPRKEGRNRR